MYVAHIVEWWQHWPQAKSAWARWQGSHCEGIEGYVNSLRSDGATDDDLRGMIVAMCTLYDHTWQSWRKPAYVYFDALTLERSTL